MADGSAETAARARAWRYRTHAAVCDVIAPWAHGTVVRATRMPSYYNFNAVRVEDRSPPSVDELLAFADEALAGLEHRQIDFDHADVAEPLRAAFGALGWRSLRLLWMRHEAAPPAAPRLAVEEVPYDAVKDLRAAWHREDFPGVDEGDHPAEARAVAMRRGVHVLAVRERGRPVAFAQLERDGDAAEITQVYVHPHHRGGGRGTAMTTAAIAAAADVRDLWICADDEDRPKDLYARLGFRPAATTMEFLRLPLP
jgi:GNAT superfamily N-acetyltransferase